MEIYKVSFIGHREIENYTEIEKKLEKIIKELLRSKEFVEFQIGRNGDFDIWVASCVKRIQHEYGNHNSALVLVLPYNVADIEFYKNYYDDIIIPESAMNAYFKMAITKRNQWMADNSDLLIAYVEREKGGAFQMLKYANKLGIKIFNIANEL